MLLGALEEVVAPVLQSDQKELKYDYYLRYFCQQLGFNRTRRN